MLDCIFGQRKPENLQNYTTEACGIAMKLNEKQKVFQVEILHWFDSESGNEQIPCMGEMALISLIICHRP